eukprot:GHVS01061583.1.p2 GENE.GHVS01061583.1~~GHVS01061583.1.p2  ORF type:complete len:137 (-),score=11.83 GHVS01061583.1:16-426(-)
MTSSSWSSSSTKATCAWDPGLLFLKLLHHGCGRSYAVLASFVTECCDLGTPSFVDQVVLFVAYMTALLAAISLEGAVLHPMVSSTGSAGRWWLSCKTGCSTPHRKIFSWVSLGVTAAAVLCVPSCCCRVTTSLRLW